MPMVWPKVIISVIGWDWRVFSLLEEQKKRRNDLNVSFTIHMGIIIEPIIISSISTKV